MWALDEDWDGSTDATRSLMLSLARPAATAEEVTWKKGKEKTVDLFVVLVSAFCAVQAAFVACKCKFMLVSMLGWAVDRYPACFGKIVDKLKKSSSHPTQELYIIALSCITMTTLACIVRGHSHHPRGCCLLLKLPFSRQGQLSPIKDDML